MKNERGTLHVGVGRTDITPPLGTLLMGYPDPYGERKAESVRDPLHATALVFEQDAERAAVVSVDVAIIEDVHVEQIRQRVQQKTGIPAPHVTVCAIQTHSAPCTQKVWGWCELDTDYIDRIMVPRAVEAITTAAGSTVPARVGIGVTHSDVGVNRRRVNEDHGVGLGQYPIGVYDPEMTVLRFETARGTLANLVHYGAHPTIFDGHSKVISRDWPGIMIDCVEKYSKAPTLFVNGAVGDVAPRSSSLLATGGGSEFSLIEVGGRAATDAMRAWRTIKDFRDVNLATKTGTFELPYRPLTPLDEAKRQLATFEPRKKEPGTGMCEFSHWQAVIEAHQRPRRTGKPYPQIITALGPVAIVPFPGEPFAETVLRLRHHSPFQYTLCASTSCGNNAYLCTRESFARGGYEPWVGKALGPYLLAEGVDDVLVEKNLALLRGVFGAMIPPIRPT